MTSRMTVQKTHKLYIGGAFPRSESGRTYPALDADGQVAARVAQASRKDLREAVRAARKAFPGWSARTGYNRGQILYRIAEMIEDRSAVFIDTLRVSGATRRAAEKEVALSIDRLVWYAGWCDKYAQVMGNLNPVAGPYFNISTPEPSGVVGIVAPPAGALAGLVSRIAPALVPGNTVVVVASEPEPLAAVALAEALATADVPGGVVNLLTGSPAELTPWLASHMDVDVLDLVGAPEELAADATRSAAESVTRVVADADPDRQSPYLIGAFTEIKTVWHPKGT